MSHDICVLCKGTGEIVSTIYEVVGSATLAKVKSECSACAGRGKIVRPYQRDNTRTNPFLLMPKKMADYEQTLVRHRHMAGVWYMRIVHPDMPHLVPLDDAIREGTDEDRNWVRISTTEEEPMTSKRIWNIYSECRSIAESVHACGEAPALTDTLKRYQVNPNRDFDFWWYVNIAMVGYRLQCSRARATRRWQRVPREFSEDYVPDLDEEVGDVLCSTCRRKILSYETSNKDRDYTDATNFHTTACVLYTWWTQAQIDPKTMARRPL